MRGNGAGNALAPQTSAAVRLHTLGDAPWPMQLEGLNLHNYVCKVKQAIKPLANTFIQRQEAKS